MNPSELALFSRPWLQLYLFQLPIMPERSPSELGGNEDGDKKPTKSNIERG